MIFMFSTGKRWEEHAEGYYSNEQNFNDSEITCGTVLSSGNYDCIGLLRFQVNT